MLFLLLTSNAYIKSLKSNACKWQVLINAIVCNSCTVMIISENGDNKIT